MNETWEDPFEDVKALSELTRQRFQTPGAGRSGKPFQVLSTADDQLEVRTSRGGRVVLRAEAFQTAPKLIGDLGGLEEGGWVRVSDETLNAVLSGENREKACGSYVLPLLEATGWVELERKRPARVRLHPDRVATEQ
ncbi:MAG: hypothetical protein JKY65_26360 [Planctomycetes bacterium]|nr:hypothetical protein [Planctomycetota bacterium]